MTHYGFMARLGFITLITGFAILALAASIPAWLVLIGAGWWALGSFVGVLIGNMFSMGANGVGAESDTGSAEGSWFPCPHEPSRGAMDDPGLCRSERPRIERS